MDKLKKIWLAVSLALFLVPEILWSPVWNFSYELWFKKLIGIDLLRNNFLTNSDNANALMAVLLIQAIGILGLFFWFLFKKNSRLTKIAGLTFCCLILLVIIFASIMFYSFRYWR